MGEHCETDESWARPRRHVHVVGAWVNDPHGLTWHRGRHHVFFQQVAGSSVWRPDVAWGHASSPDLQTWTAHPPVLLPGDGDDGCWSGGLVTTPDDQALIHYTSVRAADHALGVVREARPVDDDWQVWRKGDVVVRPPDHLDLAVFRDPVVLADGEVWRMLVGAGHGDGRPAVLGFVSDDLRSWAYDGEVASASLRDVDDPDRTGEAWECPQLFAVDGTWVLVVSVWSGGRDHHVAAATGDLVAGRFTPRRWTRLTRSDGPYAASASTDADGRPCLTSWLRGVADPAGRWTGAVGTTCRVHVVDDQVRLSPHPDAVDGLPPDEHVRTRSCARASDGPAPLALLHTSSGEPVGEVRQEGGAVVVDVPGRTTRLPGPPGDVHVLLDRVVLEVVTPGGLAAVAVPPGTRLRGASVGGA